MPRNPGLEDGIPLGFNEARHRLVRVREPGGQGPGGRVSYFPPSVFRRSRPRPEPFYRQVHHRRGRRHGHRQRLCRQRHHRSAGRERDVHAGRRILGAAQRRANSRCAVAQCETTRGQQRAHLLAVARLDQATSLVFPPATNAWSQVAFPCQTEATHVSIPLPAPAGNKFYRLRRP